MSTVLVSHLDCLAHAVPEGAPERPARLTRVLSVLDDLDLDRLPAPRARDEQIASVHPEGYAQDIRARMPTSGFEVLDSDTVLSADSENAIWRAAGGAIRAVKAVLDEDADNAFVATRPPGHHAETSLPMGFCVFGNVAIAAKYALDERGLERVAVVDFDVHHGNGTQALLAQDPRVLVASTHQSPLWPGTGAATERGPLGNWLNIPLPPGSGGDLLRKTYAAEVFPALRSHAPDLIIISAGFDAHQDDPLANLNWTQEDFRWLTAELVSLSHELCEGRLVSVLEGGYDLDALGNCVRAHVEELMKAGR